MKALYQKIPIRFRITLALIGLMVGALLMASAAGFFPNQQAEILKGRAKLCESIAVQSSVLISARQEELLPVMVDSLLGRNESIRSLALVDTEGQSLLEVGSHNAIWDPQAPISITQMHVPVYDRGEKWAELQVAFTPTGGWMGLNYWAPAWLLIVLIPACFVQFSFFLRKTLESLDPSGAVPTHVERALDTFTVGLFLLNSKCRILFANRRLAELLQCPAETLLTKEASSLDWLRPEDGDHPLPWMLAKSTGQPANDQLLQYEVDGRRLTFSVNCTPITGQGFLATFDDITLIEENKIELAKARDAAENANEAKSQFLANMSHEIRTPLNAVLGFTDVLRRGLVTDSEEAFDHLDMIHRSGAHLLELINDILDLSKIEAGRLQVEAIDTPVDRIISDVADTMRVRAQESDLELNVEFETAIPRVIQTDPTRMRQIITNLVGNAIKFTENGSVSVRTRLLPAGMEAPMLQVDVVDTGIGMTPQQQAKIFEKFVQADSSTTRKFGGTGLGLSISRQLAEAMGGSLTVSGQSGEGSTFTLTIPVTEMSLNEMVTPEEISEENNRRARLQASGLIHLPEDQTILVVDDGEGNRRLIDLVLRRAGAKTVCVTNGQEALEAVGRQSFGAILMDMQMPVMDGYTATRKLREQQVTTPVIALTGNAMKGDRQRCEEAGCDDFLAKPVNIDELLALVASYVGLDETAPLDVTEETSGCILAGSDPVESTGHVVSAGANSDEGVIHPTLPMDDPDFRQITEDFLQRLEPRIQAMLDSCKDSDWESLRQDAHWLKGAGGTVGLPVFTTPATDLEQAAKEQSKVSAEQLLQTIAKLHQRIEIPAAGDMEETASETTNQQAATVLNVSKQPIPCDLPLDDPEFCEIVTGFVERLDQRLLDFRAAADRADLGQLAREGEWLVGAAGTVGYNPLTVPGAKLVEAAKLDDMDQCREIVDTIHEMRALMQVPPGMERVNGAV